MGVEPRVSFEAGVCAREVNSLGCLLLDLNGFDVCACGQKEFRYEAGETRRVADCEMLLNKRRVATFAREDEQPRERGAGFRRGGRNETDPERLGRPCTRIEDEYRAIRQESRLQRDERLALQVRELSQPTLQ